MGFSAVKSGPVVYLCLKNSVTALLLAAVLCIASGSAGKEIVPSQKADAKTNAAALRVLNPNNQERSPRAPIDVPDPATPWLLGIGLVTLSLLRRKASPKV